VQRIHALRRAGDEHVAATMLPVERSYSLPAQVALNLGAESAGVST
jgi:hypothetical protein